jgi:LuxR family maltose regulon positive regulatory protein
VDAVTGDAVTGEGGAMTGAGACDHHDVASHAGRRRGLRRGGGCAAPTPGGARGRYPAGSLEPTSRYGLPAPPEHLVARPKLMALMDRAFRCPLTIVSSPAGTGKTVAVSTWARSRRGSAPIVWVSLGRLDLRAGLPWAMVGEELARAEVAPGGFPTGTGEQSLLGAIAGAIADHPTPVTLILDCAVELSHDDVAGLERLLNGSRGRLRLVLLTRTDPVLPLHRYRRQNALAEIRMADLAFTANETRELFAGRGLELSADELGLIVARSRGWAAGLVLTILALMHATDRGRAVRELSGSSGAIAEYLLAEVLQSQAPATRELLLRTSVADILRPGLVEELAGQGADDALSRLTRGNAFIERVAGHPSCYHFHPLFQELLRAELAYQSPDEAKRLHVVAGDWLARTGQLAEAVQTVIDADLWPVAAGYIVEQLAVAELLTPGRTVLHELLAPFPAETAAPAATLVRAALAVSGGRYDGAARELDRARQLLDSRQPGAELTHAVVSAVLASLTGDVAAVSEAMATVERRLATAGDRRLSSSPELAIVLDTVNARACLWRGPPSEAAAACGRVLAGGMRPGFEWARVECLGYLALIAAWRGENRKSVRLAQQVLALHDLARAPVPRTAPVAEAALAWVYVETDDLGRAQRHAAAASVDIGAISGVAVAVSLALVESRIRRARGDLRGARAVLVDCRRRHPMSDWLTAWMAVDEAVIDDLEGQRLSVRPAIVNSAVDAPAARPGVATTLLASVDRLLADAQRQVRRGNEDSAVQLIEDALRLAAPEHLRRPFREASAEVRSLLRSRRDIALRHGWLAADADRRRRASGSEVMLESVEPAPPEPVLPELLTDKEFEVLGHLAQLLTTDEIASAMFVSVNTIRTHVRNILRKLGASRRNQAIRRARELGILAH